MAKLQIDDGLSQALCDLKNACERVAAEIERVRPVTVLDVFSHDPNPSGFNSATAGFLSWPVILPTERTLAIAGAWFKWMVYRKMVTAGKTVDQFPEKDRQIVEWAVHNCRFVGPIGYRSGTDGQVGTADKWLVGQTIEEIRDGESVADTLLDEKQCSEFEAIPVELDDILMFESLANGELVPVVTRINQSGKPIEATRLGSFSIMLGGEKKARNFDGGSLLNSSRPSFHPLNLMATSHACDMLEDSALNVGILLLREIGKSLRNELDWRIAYGSGIDEIEGVFNRLGAVSVCSVGGSGGEPQIGDYESLYFAVPKEYRIEVGACFVYLGTDTSYRRARGIPTDSQNDARRFFGGDNQESYELLGSRPYKIAGGIYRKNDSRSAPNSLIAGFMANRYRLTRVLGIGVHLVCDDAEVSRKNNVSAVIRQLFSGGLDDGAACAKITDAKK